MLKLHLITIIIIIIIYGQLNCWFIINEFQKILF